MSLLESLEKRIERIEFWQRVELVMLGSIIGEKVLTILLPLLA